ncbi:hypothetical protein ACS0TY_014044 [Phlomoides rotata]
MIFRPEQPKEKTPTMSSVAMSYTGGDIKRSGELARMLISLQMAQDLENQARLTVFLQGRVHLVVQLLTQVN